MGSPVYIQIHNQLRENIENGHWKVGQKSRLNVNWQLNLASVA